MLPEDAAPLATYWPRLLCESLLHTVRLMCWQAHLGLCATKDAEVYERSLDIAKVLLDFFSKDKLYKHFRLHKDDGPFKASNCIYLWLGHRRSRRPEAYVTAGLSVLKEKDGCLKFSKDAHGGLSWAGVHHVAKLLARLAWHEIHATELDFVAGFSSQLCSPPTGMPTADTDPCVLLRLAFRSENEIDNSKQLASHVLWPATAATFSKPKAKRDFDVERLPSADAPKMKRPKLNRPRVKYQLPQSAREVEWSEEESSSQHAGTESQSMDEKDIKEKVKLKAKKFCAMTGNGQGQGQG